MSTNPYQVNPRGNIGEDHQAPGQNVPDQPFNYGNSNAMSNGTGHTNGLHMKNEVIMPTEEGYQTTTGEDRKQNIWADKDKNGKANGNAETIALTSLNVAHRQNLEMQMGEEYKPADFTDRKTRNGFIKKVFGILSVQLFITFMFTLATVLSSELQAGLLKHWYVMIISAVISMIIIYVIIYTRLGRKVPWNYILLFIFTVCQSVTVGYVTAITVRASEKGPMTVALAAGLTAAIVISLSLFAACTKKDFTKCGPFLMVCLVALMIGSICFYFFFRRSMILNLIICVAGVIIFGLYLIMDIQMVIGDKKRKIQKDDYIIGAMMLYIDIIQIFLYLLQLIGAVNR